MSVQTSTFTSNSAPLDTIFSGSQFSSFNDVGSTFSGNTATSQNSIGSMSQGAGSTFSGSKFLQNAVTGSLGTLIFNMQSDITFTGIQVVDNTFAGGYKHLFILSSTIITKSSTFNTNSPVTVSTDASQGGYFNMID